MKLTLSKVHRLLGQVLGAEAVTLQNHVGRVEEEDEVVGVMLSSGGVLYYSPSWWDENINTPQKARHVILFEIMRKVLGVDQRMGDWIDRVASGAVINAYLYHTFGFHELPRAMYSAIDLPECLMRPNARGFHSRLKRVYRGIWKREKRFTSVSNVAHALRILFGDTSLTSKENIEEMSCLGYAGPSQHGVTDRDREFGFAESSDPWEENLLEHCARGIEQRAQSAGFSPQAGDYITKKMRSRKSVETTMVEDYALDKIKKQLRKHFEGSQKEMSMLPSRISARDAFKLAMGWCPVYFENDVDKEDGRSGGLVIYMDVSGSYHMYIPYTLGLVESCADLVEEMYQFSNIVHPISTEEIRKNDVKIMSTGGTDLDCVVEHAVKNGHNKVVIITDGWCDVNNLDLRVAAEETIDAALVVLCTSLPGFKNNNRIPFDATKQAFIDGTWFGGHYKAVADIAEAFK